MGAALLISGVVMSMVGLALAESAVLDWPALVRAGEGLYSFLQTLFIRVQEPMSAIGYIMLIGGLAVTAAGLWRLKTAAVLCLSGGAVLYALIVLLPVVAQR